MYKFFFNNYYLSELLVDIDYEHRVQGDFQP